MSKKHEIKEDGELFISHIAAKKRFNVSKKQLHQWAREGKIRQINREIGRMPHQLVNDPQLELTYFNEADIKKVLDENEA